MNQIVLLSWNVRGLNARARRDAVRVLIGDTRTTIVHELLERIKPDIRLWIAAGARRLGCLKRE